MKGYSYEEDADAHEGNGQDAEGQHGEEETHAEKGEKEIVLIV
jgi:hypothetical protein